MSTILLILAGAGFFIGGSFILYWAVSTGQFNDPEAIKYRIFED